MSDFKFDILDLLGRTKLESRPYQQRIIHRTMQCFAPEERGGKGLHSVMVNSPTGSGKTCVALSIIKGLQEYCDCLAIWISMRRNLLAQAAAENISKGVNAKIDFISMFDKNLPQHLLPANRNGRKLLMCIDEAQHDAADSCTHIHTVLEPEFSLGLSATPFRSDCLKLCFNTVINDAGIGTLIKDGWLSQFEHYTIPKWDIEAVCNVYLREPKRWGKTIFYFHRITQCEEALALLTAGGVRTEMVTGSSDRDSQLDRFRTGETTALVNCMVLTEGLDVPDLESVFCRDSCKGVTIQMCGRSFRKHPKIAFKKIVQSQNTRWPFVKTAEPIASYKWDSERPEGGWLALKKNEHIDKIGCRVLVALANINTQLPDYITNAAMKKKGRSARRPIPQRRDDD